MIEIQNNAPQNISVNIKMIKSGVLNTLNFLGQKDVDITIRFTDNEELKDLNQRYRGITKTTDVLSFNQDIVNPETNRIYLGDIIISAEKANEQANEINGSFDEECTLLAIHGMLHLLGYDHYVPEEKEEMWTIQEKILKMTVEQNQ
jgi:probable rRNA maturation factor